MKKVLKGIAVFLVLLLILVFSLIGRIDRTPLRERSFYQKMMKKLDTLQLDHFEPKGKVKVGWSNANITPDHNMPMAGYLPRDSFKLVHDSIFTRIMTIDNGSISAYFISIDLLIFPPSIAARVRELWAERKINEKYFLFFSATHTHSSVGAWHKSMLGRFAIGKYNQTWVDAIAQRIVDKMEEAERTKLPAKISYLECDASRWVENRVAFEEGKVDGKVRGIAVIREDDSKGLCFSFSAHATTVGKELPELSGDYPAAIINILKSKGWDFGMFMSGMVGSHRFIWTPEQDYDAIRVLSKAVADRMDSAAYTPYTETVNIVAKHIPIEFGPSQLRFDKDLKLRDWAFRLLAAKLEGEFTYLAINDMVFIGTPCDFSGEIFVESGFDSLEKQKNKHLVITSFNGYYTGYVTYDPHYEKFSKEEVMALNWVGPYYGQYYTEMLTKILNKN